MPDTWTIDYETGDADANELNDFIINRTSTGFDIVDPTGIVKASTTASAPTFSFDFSYDGHAWTVTVTSLTSGANGDGIAGTWSNDDTPAAEEDGTFTGQAGGTDPKTASSAAAK